MVKIPWSSDEGKPWLLERILAHKPTSILDIGVGAGTYSDLLRPHLPDARFIGIEVHAKYVERFHLALKYDELHVKDVRAMNNLPLADVVILGDVIEHMWLLEADWLWRKARMVAKAAVFLSLPIVPYPQGACEGNEHEAHLVTWDHKMVMEKLPGIRDFWRGPREIGVYEAVPDE